MKARVYSATRRAVQCSGKERYEAPALAHEVVRRRRRKRLERPLVVYRCPCCGFFHIGGLSK